MSIEKTERPLEVASARETAARTAFLRCLCKELREQNEIVLSAAVKTETETEPEPLRRALQQSGDAARTQQELLAVLENLLKCL